MAATAGGLLQFDRNAMRPYAHSPFVSFTIRDARRARSFLLQTVAASAVMTASQRAEMLATRREPSDLPVQVVEHLTRQSISGAAARATVGHLAQGSLAAGAVLLARLTRHGSFATSVALIAISLVAGDAVLAWTLGLAQPPWRWAPRELATDVSHKTSLAIAARTLTTRRR